MIFVTGDTHIPYDVGKLSSKRFPEGKTLSKKDYVIICGDFGGVWDGSNHDRYWLDWLNDKPWTTLFVDGNHENFPLLYEYPMKYWKGGRVHRIRQSIFHLCRGYVFNIQAKKFFCMGGASSHDKEMRTEFLSWWKEELPNKRQYDRALKNLDKNEWRVDFVISHCGSDRVQRLISPYYEYDSLTRFFDVEIEKRLSFDHWYMGHYHINKDLDEKHTVLYNEIRRIV